MLFLNAPLWVTHFRYLDGCEESSPATGVAGDDRTQFEVLDNFCYFEVLGLFKGVPVILEIISCLILAFGHEGFIARIDV